MTWTISVPVTPKDMFAFDVDNAQPTGQDGPGVNEDAMLCKAVLKSLAARVKRPYLSGAITGNTLQLGNSDATWDGFSVSIMGHVSD